jgi:hypothetical protein
MSEDIDPFEMLNMQASYIKSELDYMFETKQITEDNYNKDIVSLAYEYALNRFAEDCLKMLFNIKNNYFKLRAQDHFKEDAIYFAKCSLIFEVLSFVGKVPYDILCTQKLAKA